MDRPTHAVRTVHSIRSMPGKGPWTTKSKGQLSVVFAMSIDEALREYFRYEQTELDRVPSDIRGFRIYMITGLAKGSIGGGEWHRIREEMVFVLNGSVRWTCTDLYGGRQTLMLTPSMGLWMPPFLLHTYEVCEEGTSLLVVANTLFAPDDPATHDTYPASDFAELQQLPEYLNRYKE